VRISKKSEYGLRALVELNMARRGGQDWLQIAQIAQTTGIPEKFLEQILLVLKKAGLLQSRRGSVGGYALEADPARIDADLVVKLLEGEIWPEPGKTGRGDAGVAVYQELIRRAGEAARGVLAVATLDKLTDETLKKHASARGGSEYQI
jgi:Rrf2 family protein